MNSILSLSKKDIISLEMIFLVFIVKTRHVHYVYILLGNIVLDLKKSTKTNNIKLSLEGVAEIGGKSTTIYSKSIYVSQPPQGEKSYLLDACTHRFPFTMRIPKASDYELPSTLMVNNKSNHNKLYSSYSL
jgi:hypothetical protein